MNVICSKRTWIYHILQKMNLRFVTRSLLPHSKFESKTELQVRLCSSLKNVEMLETTSQEQQDHSMGMRSTLEQQFSLVFLQLGDGREPFATCLPLVFLQLGDGREAHVVGSATRRPVAGPRRRWHRRGRPLGHSTRSFTAMLWAPRFQIDPNLEHTNLCSWQRSTPVDSGATTWTPRQDGGISG
jgi:hypothetical protein